MDRAGSAALRILPEGRLAAVPTGVTLRKALLGAGIPVRGNCGGNGTCGQCRVRANGEWVLSCEHVVDGDATVFVPVSSRVPSGRLLDQSIPPHHRPHAPVTNARSESSAEQPRGGNAQAPPLPGQVALAIDAGTTTISLSLLSLSPGEGAVFSPGGLLATRSVFNPQIAFGDDVISRINYAQQNAGGPAELRDAIMDEINRQTRALLLAMPRLEIVRVVIAGNTTMMRILLGLDLEPVRSDTLGDWAMKTHCTNARDVGLDESHDVPVLILPVVSGWIGGDVVAGVLSSGMAERPGVRLLIDLGTNGEMVMGCRDWLVACSCSAGPAFEGGGIAWGMPAGPGAIDRVNIDPHDMSVHCDVIGGERPEGICGSGLVSALKSMLSAGIIDRSGRLVDWRQDSHGYDGLQAGSASSGWQAARDIAVSGKFRVATSRWDEEITLSSSDLMTAIRAKAAVYAGMKTLEQELGIGLDSLDEILVAGGFGSSLDIESAVAIGLLPDLPRTRFRVIGNSSLQGAVVCAMSPEAASLAQAIARRVTYMDLTRHPGFQGQFTRAMFLPHTDLEQFASQSSRRPGQSS